MSVRRVRRVVSRVVPVLLAGALLALLPSTSAQAADRAFAPRFTTNTTGDVDIIGNTLMTCSTAASGCSSARNAGVSALTDSAVNNNSFSMSYVDMDSDPTTFNSSMSPLMLPGTATVLFAGLYWGGEVGTSGTAFNARGTVKLKVPGAAGYSAVTASTIDDGSPIYQGFANITSQVKAAGSGTYTVADVQAYTGSDRLAGWSIVVAYSDPTLPARNLSIFDGLKSVSSTGSSNIAVTGFQTPPSGTVNSTLGIVTYEGDLGLVGDSASLNGHVLSDAQHPATNFFDSRISRKGVLRSINTPSYDNNLGFEQTTMSVGSYIPNGATSATIGLTTSGDVYAPGVITLATDLYAPRLEQTKTVTDLDGGDVEQGDVLRYTVSGTNTGSDGAAGLVLRDPLPADVTYVPGSIKVTQPGGSATPRSDDAGDDVAEYDGANNRVVARLGTGANATSGGTIAPGASYAVSFEVTVNGPSLPVADGAQITNTAVAAFTGQSLGTAYTTDSAATVAVRSPDLTIAKTHTGSLVRGSSATFSLVVSNVGHAATQGQVAVSDLLPAGLTVTSLSGPGWTCTRGTLSCVRSDALAAGHDYPAISLVASVGDDAPAQVANTGTVSGGGDASAANNAAVDAAPTVKLTDLELTKTADTTSPAVGDVVTYPLTVTNHGPSSSTGSTVVDHLPAGLVYVSDDGDCTADATSSTLTCAVGPLAAGASAQVSVRARPAVGTAGSTLGNTASVAANEPDPVSSNDTAAVEVHVAPVDLAITSQLTGSPASLMPGQTYLWALQVTANGGSSATDTEVHFTVPAGLDVVAGALDPRCALQAGSIVCHLGTLLPGSTVPGIAVPAKVAPGSTLTIDTVATVSTTEHESDLTDNAATTSTPVVTAVDLAATITSSQSSVSAGDPLTLHVGVTNNGPGTPVAPTVTIPVPDGTTFVSADPGCSYSVADHAVTCVLAPADLEAGESVAKDVQLVVAPGADDVLTATATTHTGSSDSDPSNDTGVTTVMVINHAGLSIAKSVDKATAAPGDVVAYTLTVHNSGPGAAHGTVVADTLPAGVSFAGVAVTTGSGTCGHTGPAVSCTLGDVGVGGTAVVRITATVDATSGAAGTAHQLAATKVETDLGYLPAGASTTATASCPSGYLATDGSVRVDDVAQGAGSPADVQVLASHATADGSGWTASVTNRTTGQAQGKVEVVCLSAATVDGQSHQHPVVVSAPVTTSHTLTAGSWPAALSCGPGQVAIAPGFDLTAGYGVVRVSEQAGTGWHFALDVPENASVTYSARCPSTSLGMADGHSHNLTLRQVTKSVTVGPGQQQVQLICGDDAKGIVGSYDLEPDLVSLGSDPQPKSRVFRLDNTSGQSRSATLGLLCLDLHTGGTETPTSITNTAHVTTTSSDATTDDDVASATFTASGATGPVALPVAVPGAARLVGAAATVRVTSTKAGKVTVRIISVRAVRGTSVHRGTVLAHQVVRVQRGAHQVRVPMRQRFRQALRHGHVDKVRITIATAGGRTVTRVVRLHR